jgi:transcriptional regulator with XRE-family HTH domain
MPGGVRRAKEAFGGRLREIRQDAGLTGRQLAELTGLHFTKISRIEHGGQGLSDAEIHLWCDACGVGDQIPGLVAQARAVESMYREWRRQARTGLRRLQEKNNLLYERTTLFRWHEHWSVPGLLMTAAYSTASTGYWINLLDLPDDRDAATEARLELQRVLRSDSRRFVFLLAEQVLRTRVGSEETMIEQLDRLLGVKSMPNVSIGIIPANAGLGAHTQTAFSIYDDELVKVETLTAGLEISAPEEVDIYIKVFGQMNQAAVFGDDARDLIIKARDEYLQ